MNVTNVILGCVCATHVDNDDSLLFVGAKQQQSLPRKVSQLICYCSMVSSNATHELRG